MIRQAEYEGKRGWYDDTTQEFLPEDSWKAADYDGKSGIFNPQTNEFVEAGLPTAKPASKPSDGYLSKLEGALSKRTGNVASEWKAKPDESVADSFTMSGKRLLRTAGQGAGLVGDVIGESLVSLYKTVVPEKTQEEIKDALKRGFKTETGQKALGIVQTGMEKYGEFKKANPELAKDVEASANVLSMIPIGKGGQLAGRGAKEGINIGRDIVGITRRVTPQEVDKQILSVVTRGMEKGVRPSVTGKQTARQTGEYFKKAQSAVEDIIENKSNLKFIAKNGGEVIGETPKTLKQFSEAIEQTRTNIFEKYNAMALKAGEKQIEVDLNPVIKELEKIASGKVMGDLSPNISKYAANKAMVLSERGKYTPMEAQDAIKMLNEDLKSFYRNPSYDSASRARIDATIAYKLRESLDEAIEKASGAGYQELKNKYGSLKAIEKEVNHRALIDARKNFKGLADFSDVFSGAYAVHGIITMNPGVMGAAAAKAVTKWYQHLNSPNTHIKKMFVNAEKLMQKRSMAEGAYKPKSGYFKGSPPEPKTVNAEFRRISGELPEGQGFTMQGEPYTRALPPGQGFEMMNPIVAEALRMKLGLPPGTDIKLLPRFTGSSLSMEEIRDALPKMYKGRVLPVERIDSDLLKELNEFLIRREFPVKTKFK